MIAVTLPISDRHTQVKIIMVAPCGHTESIYDDSHKVVEIETPADVDHDDIEVYSQFIGRNGQVDETMRPMLLKEKVVKPHVQITPEANQEVTTEIGSGDEQTDASDEQSEPEHKSACGQPVCDASDSRAGDAVCDTDVVDSVEGSDDDGCEER